MTGTIRFDLIPRLPVSWWLEPDAKSVWPTWGEDNSYFWGANAGNQFLDRGTPLNGGGLASTKGPSRGYAHSQYVGLDTMSASTQSLAANKSVYTRMSTYLAAGHSLIIPVDLRPNRKETGKFSLGTGIGKTAPNGTKIHQHIWCGILQLINEATSVSYCDQMWTPDFSLPKDMRMTSRFELPDYEAINAYHAKLVAAENAAG